MSPGLRVATNNVVTCKFSVHHGQSEHEVALEQYQHDPLNVSTPMPLLFELIHK